MEPIVLENFSGGLVARPARYAQPPNSVSRISNLYYVQPGALTVIDGTTVISSLNGAGPAAGQNPIVSIHPFTPPGSTATLLALQVGVSTTLIDVTGTSYAGNLGSIASTNQAPDLLMFNNKLVIVTGNAVVPRTWDGAVLSSISNAWTSAGYVPSWQANLPVQFGDVIQPTPSNGFFYIAIQPGVTGIAAPAFPTTPVKATVVDNSIIWQLVGSTTADTPGAAHAFNHLSSLWLWGTRATDLRYDGPSSLRMSDVGNENSYNPVNQDFIGVGDGQTAQGGAVMATGSEAGIAANNILVLFKDRSTYEVIGSFPFATANRAKTELGCIAPRTAKFVRALSGIIRFTYSGFALYRGSQDVDPVISDSISQYIFGASDVAAVDFTQVSIGKAALVRYPEMYLAALPLVGGGGSLTRVFAFDIALKAWSIFDLPFAVSALQLVEMPGLAPYTALAGASDGAIRNWFKGAGTWDAGASNSQIVSSLTAPLVATRRKIFPAFFRRVNVKTNGGSPKMTAVSLSYDATPDGSAKTLTLNPKDLPSSLDTGGVTVRSVALSLTLSGQTTIEALEFDGKSKPPRPFAPI